MPARIWNLSCFNGFFAILALCCLFLNGCSVLQGKKSAQQSSSKKPCIVLALPDSGPYSAISTKIRHGAQESKLELAKTGINVRIENLNTESPSWLTALDALPAECAVVGGPMREKSYLAAEKAGALEKRAFFAFMPTLKATDEGKRAWRFFPSPRDQIEALVRFAADELGIRSFGSFYPSDSYGQRMTKILETTLVSKNMTLKKASYNPKTPGTWSNSAAELVQPIQSPGKSPVPQTTFEAVLLPDSWKNVDKITSSLLVNGEDRLVLMGTTLWEQGLSGKQVPNAQNYALAIFPGAWNRARAPKSLKGANNDFWTALGYDFIRFAAHIGLSSRPTATEITTYARQSSPAMRALAPITYDGHGVAHEKLHLFQISSTGMKPANVQELRQKRQQIQEQAALRIRNIQAEITPEPGLTQESADYSEEPASSNSAPTQISAPVEPEPQHIPSPAIMRPASPQTPAQPQLGTVPQPSYKLRLPVKK